MAGFVTDAVSAVSAAVCSRRAIARGLAGGALGVAGAIRTTPRTQATTHSASIVVVGAGMSGIACAYELTSRGRRVIVLEARDRIGGRMWTDDSLGFPVDLGAAWIHGSTGNPIAQLARDMGIATVVSDIDDWMVFDTDGAELDDATLEEIEAGFSTLLDRAVELGDELDEDLSLGEGIRLAAEEQRLDADERRYLNFASAELEIEYGAGVDELSLWSWNSEDAYPGDHLLLPAGYDQIPRELAAELDVRTGVDVTAIAYSGDSVIVETSAGQFSAEHVVVTAPLGVLKQRSIVFDPPLPRSYTGAIERLGMGVLNKVVLRFDEIFWPEQREWFNLVPASGRAVTEFLNLAAHVDAPVLVALMGGPFARALEAQSDDEIVAQALAALTRMFGVAPAPTAVLVTRWASDRFAGGSYSHLPVGASNDDYDQLATPIEGRLLLAGEHTNSQFPATVHGAYLSGIRAANQIAE